MAFIDDLRGIEKVIPLRDHFIKSWNRKVYFLPLSGKESEAAKALMGVNEATASMWAAFVVIKALDENRKRLFLNEHYQEVNEMHFQAEFEELYKEIQKTKSVADAVEAFTTTLV
jgi:hypothetical protein